MSRMGKLPVALEGVTITINGRTVTAKGSKGELSVDLLDDVNIEQTDEGPVRMIGAGTLSKRLRSSPPSFNEVSISDGVVSVRARNLADVATADMQIDDIPEDAMPPRRPGEPIAPIHAVPPVDPPVH